MKILNAPPESPETGKDGGQRNRRPPKDVSPLHVCRPPNVQVVMVIPLKEIRAS
jgi:hypothetical protein